MICFSYCLMTTCTFKNNRIEDTPKIDNIPGFYGISGQHFINLMGCQIQSIVEAGFGSIDIEYSEVVDVSGMVLTDGVVVHTLKTENDDCFCAQKVIFATDKSAMYLSATIKYPKHLELRDIKGVDFIEASEEPEKNS